MPVHCVLAVPVGFDLLALEYGSVLESSLGKRVLKGALHNGTRVSYRPR